MKCALVNIITGEVENTIMADIENDITPEGYALVAVRDTDPIDQSGWIYDAETKSFTKTILAP